MKSLNPARISRERGPLSAEEGSLPPDGSMALPSGGPFLHPPPWSLAQQHAAAFLLAAKLTEVAELRQQLADRCLGDVGCEGRA